MSGSKEEVEVSWFLQESLKEKTIHDAAGISDNVKIAGDGTIAVVSKSKVHIFSPQGCHQQFFSTEWLVLEVRNGENEEISNHTTPLQWLRNKLSITPTSIKDIQWLECPIDSLIFWNLCVLLSDGDLILLRSSFHNFNCQNQTYSTENSNIGCSNQGRGILWQYKISSFSNLYGTISCISIGNTHNQKKTPTLFTVHQDQIICWDPSNLQFSPLFHISTSLLQIPLTSIVKMSSYWMNEEDSNLSLLCCAQHNVTYLLHVSNISFEQSQMQCGSNSSSTITIDQVKHLPHEGYFIFLHCDNLSGRFALVTSKSIFSGNLANGDFDIHTHHHNQAVDIMGVSFPNFDVSNLEKSSSPQNCILTCHRSGEIHCLHLNSNNTSHMDGYELHQSHCISKWSSRRAIFGSSGLAVDNLSSLIFITYNAPALLNSSRDVQLKSDLGRPTLLLRSVSSHLLDMPRFGMFAWEHRTYYIYCVMMRGNRYPNDSNILLLLRLLLLMQDWNEIMYLLRINDIALPPHVHEVLKIIQQAKELLKNQGEMIQDFVVDFDVLNEQRDVYYSNMGENSFDDETVDELGEEDAGNAENSAMAVDDSDSDLSASIDHTPAANSSSSKKNSTAAKASAKKSASKGSQKKPPGFTLKYLYQELKTLLPPNPFALVHILLHKWVYSVEMLTVVGAASAEDQFYGMDKDIIIEKLRENEDVSHLIAIMNESNPAFALNIVPSQLLSLHNINGYAGLDSLSTAIVLKSLRYRLSLLSQLHMCIAGLVSAIGIPIQRDYSSHSKHNLENHLQLEYANLLVWVKIRILQIRCILFLHRLRRQNSLSNLPAKMNLQYMQYVLSLSLSSIYTASSYFSPTISPAQTSTLAPVLRDSMLFLSCTLPLLPNTCTIHPISVRDNCDICTSPLTTPASHHPRECLSAYCLDCDIHFDRCCFSLQLLTSTSTNSNNNNSNSSSGMTPSTHDTFYCSLCQAVTQGHTLRELALFLKSTSLSDDTSGATLEYMDSTAVRNVFCPYCHIKMKLL